MCCVVNKFHTELDIIISTLVYKGNSSLDLNVFYIGSRNPFTRDQILEAMAKVPSHNIKFLQKIIYILCYIQHSEWMPNIGKPSPICAWVYKDFISLVLYPYAQWKRETPKLIDNRVKQLIIALTLKNSGILMSHFDHSRFRLHNFLYLVRFQ